MTSSMVGALKSGLSMSELTSISGSLSPVIVGSAYAFYQGSFSFIFFILLVITSALLHSTCKWFELFCMDNSDDYELPAKESSTTESEKFYDAEQAQSVSKTAKLYIFFTLYMLTISCGFILSLLVFNPIVFVLVLATSALCFIYILYYQGEQHKRLDAWAITAAMIGFFAVTISNYLFTGQIQLHFFITTMILGLLYLCNYVIAIAIETEKKGGLESIDDKTVTFVMKYFKPVYFVLTYSGFIIVIYSAYKGVVPPQVLMLLMVLPLVIAQNVLVFSTMPREQVERYGRMSEYSNVLRGQRKLSGTVGLVYGIVFIYAGLH